MPQKSLTVLLFLFLSACQSGLAQPASNSEYREHVLVVFNNAVPESVELAKYYAEQRKIPDKNVIGLDCPVKETITRAEYDETIAIPLRARLTQGGYWKLARTANGDVAEKNDIKIVALIYGMPMRIDPTPQPPTGEVDPATGKPVPPPPNYQKSDGASVDSELAILGIVDHEVVGPLKNPWFGQTSVFKDTPLSMMMLVGRIDGPDAATARRLIDDAIAVEKTGLWGKAYIDIAQLATLKGKGYESGDESLTNLKKLYHRVGIPVNVDLYPQLIPPFYPMGSDVIFYFGWYIYHANGPFKEGDFRFRKGAIASHLHSYSATTVKTTVNYWVGPLLARGAAAVLGTVYEPFLTFVTRNDLFNARLLEGHTFIEAAWNASPAVSWMNVMIGDPLYQPFKRDASYGKDPDADYKALRVASNRWGADPNPSELLEKVALAAKKMESPALFEYLGARYEDSIDFEKARAAYTLAAALFTDPEDKLRIGMHLAEILRSEGKKDDAVAHLRKIADEYKEIPEHQAALAWANQLDPPPPPLPEAKPVE